MILIKLLKFYTVNKANFSLNIFITTGLFVTILINKFELQLLLKLEYLIYLLISVFSVIVFFVNNIVKDTNDTVLGTINFIEGLVFFIPLVFVYSLICILYIINFIFDED